MLTVAANALEDLFNAAKQEQGYELIARSGYRSYQTQVTLYNNYVTTNGRIRALTVRETYRLMGFPDDFKIVVSKAQALKQLHPTIALH